ncbi:MAG: hypothetical protein MUC43_19610 [Pirellula sp.]|nr:hypothetical protein [Pirellula sp.]
MSRLLIIAEHIRDQWYVCLIADGVHLPVWLLESWLKRLPTNKVILTIDSMIAAGMPPGAYLIGGQPILVDAEPCAPPRPIFCSLD